MNAVVCSLLDGATDDDDVVRASICKALGDVASLHRAFQVWESLALPRPPSPGPPSPSSQDSTLTPPPSR